MKIISKIVNTLYFQNYIMNTTTNDIIKRVLHKPTDDK